MQKSSNYHPATQILLLIILSLIGAAIFSFLGVIAWLILDPQASLTVITNQENMAKNMIFIKLMQIFSSTGMFIAAPISFAFINQQKPKSYFNFDKPLSQNLVFLVILILLFSNPVFDLLIKINQNIPFPDFLKTIEDWMKQKENEMGQLTKQLLVMKTYGDLSINLLMIAVIPAIGEELFFRGGMQNIFKIWFKNHHLAIWITAILFSAIHLQFFGFFPRLFLGALFGYMLVYGKSIWLPILGHFLNNASAVVYAYIIQKNGESLETLEKAGDYPYPLYAISSIITLVLLWIFYKQTKNEKSISYE
jgi:membrane protease YdiL (CAAX protease family)